MKVESLRGEIKVPAYSNNQPRAQASQKPPANQATRRFPDPEEVFDKNGDGKLDLADVLFHNIIIDRIKSVLEEQQSHPLVKPTEGVTSYQSLQGSTPADDADVVAPDQGEAIADAPAAPQDVGHKLPLLV